MTIAVSNGCSRASLHDFSPSAIRAHAYAAQRFSELAARPLLADGCIGAELGPAPLPPLTSALVRRRHIFGPVDLADSADILSGEPADRMSGKPIEADPIFHVIAELDRAASALTAVLTAWADGPHSDRDDDSQNGVEAAAAANDAARDRLMVTCPTTELGAAAYRAAVQRYVGRPTGSGVEGDAMRVRLDAMLAASV